MDELVVKPGEIILLDKQSSGVNPALVYHDSKAVGSRPAIRSVLCRIAGWLLNRDGAATWAEVTNLPWWELRARHVSVIRARLVETVSPRTVNRDLSILRAVITVAWANEQISTDAYQHAVHVKGVDKDTTKAGRTLTGEELKTLFVTCTEFGPKKGSLMAAMLVVMFGAGLRRIEITRLSLEDVDLTTGTLHVLGKRNKKRAAYLDLGWCPFLEHWITVRGHAPGPLFTHHNGKAYTPKGISSVVEHVRFRARLEHWTPHDLRRTFGTMLLRTKDLLTVQKLMGHANLSTTRIYDHRTEDEAKAAVSALAPDKLK